MSRMICVKKIESAHQDNQKDAEPTQQAIPDAQEYLPTNE